MHGLLKYLWSSVFACGSWQEADDAVVQNLLDPDDDEVQRKLNAARAKKTWRCIALFGQGFLCSKNR